jgi:hypothetical protein
MPVIIDGSAGITTPGETNTGNLSVAGTTTLTTPLPVASGGTGGSATPTAGGVVYGTGTAQAVTSAGSAGQVLQSNGASAPTWVTPSAGAMTFISTTTASNSATVDIALSGSYTSFQIIFYNIRPASVSDFQIQYTTNNFSSASNWENTSLYAYSHGGSNVSTTTGGSLFNNQASSASYPGSGTITLPNPLGSGVKKSYVGLVQANANTIGTYTGMVSGINESTSALNGVRFIAASGNLTSGTFKLYGIT